MSGKPHRDSPCGTPGTVYETVLHNRQIVLRMKLPASLIGDLTDAEKERLVSELHGAIIPTMEWLFSRTWSKFFAGKTIGACGDWPLPETHEELFELKAAAFRGFTERGAGPTSLPYKDRP